MGNENERRRMLTSVRRCGHSGADNIILLNHHPDLARRPSGALGDVKRHNRCTAVTWNVFRTLHLITPSFWLRRFRARFVGLSSLEPPSRSSDVRLWFALPAPPQSGYDEAIDVDVIVETDTAVYGVLVFNESDVDTGDSTRACPDVVLRVIDAVSWYAGVRECYVALVTSDPSHTPIGTALVRRYGASRSVTFRRLSHRRDRLANVAGIGGLTWADMASILRDCAEADALTEFERYAASRTAHWLGSIGIHPVD
jgi:hypothetical protein